ncbi:MAG: FHA domain-containing protein [Lachnospiraceae bacterium]|jgi:hypothetical protein|nr:FHA domain-containing protein [Lachnospiraceae bacterium]
MGVVQCPRGHFYDDRKFRSCPHCEKAAGNEDSATVRMADDVIKPQTLKVLMENSVHYEGDFDQEKTVAFIAKEKGNDFVTGWVVCTEGPEKGRSYTLHHGFNRISRSNDPETDIQLAEDRQISRGCHCAIVYDYKKNTFYLVPREGNLVYMKDEFLQQPATLTTGDCFKIGDSELTFVAFCRGEWKWER